MRVICLLENTSKTENITAEHGLSLYIETDNCKILFDMGQTDMFADNAQKLGVDLSKVDFAILSHGHYDHGGGLKKFFEINKTAPVYMSKYAFEPHYNGTEKYIGLDTSLEKSDRIIFTDDVFKINNQMTLYSCNDREKKYPANSFGLLMKNGENFVDDDFRHEQYLEVTENDKKILVSGCSHKGILNIMNWFSPDVLIGGFHFTKLLPYGDTVSELTEASEILCSYPAVYYTCHCTGVQQYDFMKEILSDRINYVSAGDRLDIF